MKELEQQLEKLVPSLPLMDWDGLESSPRVLQLLEQVASGLADADVLEQFGYYTIDQACTKICDILQEGKLARTRTFGHCGIEHPCHVLQFRVACPICASKIKLSWEDDIETVAFLALHWLQINPKSIPNWNSGCEA